MNNPLCLLCHIKHVRVTGHALVCHVSGYLWYLWVFFPLKKRCFLSQKSCGWNLIILKDAKYVTAHNNKQTKNSGFFANSKQTSSVVFTAHLCFGGPFHLLACVPSSVRPYILFWLEVFQVMDARLSWHYFLYVWFCIFCLTCTFLKHLTVFHVSVLWNYFLVSFPFQSSYYLVFTGVSFWFYYFIRTWNIKTNESQMSTTCIHESYYLSLVLRYFIWIIPFYAIVYFYFTTFQRYMWYFLHYQF